MRRSMRANVLLVIAALCAAAVGVRGACSRDERRDPRRATGAAIERAPGASFDRARRSSPPPRQPRLPRRRAFFADASITPPLPPTPQPAASTTPTAPHASPTPPADGASRDPIARTARGRPRPDHPAPVGGVSPERHSTFLFFPAFFAPPATTTPGAGTPKTVFDSTARRVVRLWQTNPLENESAPRPSRLRAADRRSASPSPPRACSGAGTTPSPRAASA